MKSKCLDKHGRDGHILRIATVCAAAVCVLYIVPGCAQNSGGTNNAGGIGGTGIHGELNAGTTVNPNDPTNINIGVGGKIYFAKRPLTLGEKKEIHDAAFNLATTLIKGGVNSTTESREKAKLIDRLRYRYRVHWSIVRPFVDAAWKEAQEKSGP